MSDAVLLLEEWAQAPEIQALMGVLKGAMVYERAGGGTC